MTTTSAEGWSARAAAIGGEFVSTVQARSCGQAARDLEVGRRAVEQDDLRAGEEPDGGLGERGLRLGRRSRAGGERAPLRGGRERAAVHALDEALRRELAQVAADRVLGDAELLTSRAATTLPSRASTSRIAWRRSTLRSPFLHGLARSCMVLHVCAGASRRSG